MLKKVTVREAQQNLARVLRLVEQGNDVQVVRRNVPVARIVPIRVPGAAVQHPDFVARARAVWKKPRGERLSDLVLADRKDRT